MADELTLKYVGGPAETGELDAYAVGGSILAFGDLVSSIADAVYEERSELRTTVRGLRGDSFDIDFMIYLVGVTLPLLGPDPFTFADYLKMTLETYKHLNGSPPREVSVAPDGSSSNVVNNHGTIINVFPEIPRVLNDDRTGKAVERIVRDPCLRGVERVTIEQRDENGRVVPVFEVDSSEAEQFRRLPAGAFDPRAPLVATTDRWLIVETVTLVESRRQWRFRDGTSSFGARIEDENFLRRLHAGREIFAAGDQLRVRLRTTQSLEGTEIHATHVVEEVYEHRHAARQIGLFGRES